jgi:hypothetical protein
MLELLKAIKTAYSADASLSGATTGIYFSQAPQNATMPYIVVHGIAMTPKRYLTDELEEDARIQFSIWSDNSGVAQIGTIYEYLNICFDEADIDIDDYTNIRLEREMTTPPMRVDETWHMAVDFRWLVAHSNVGGTGYNEGGYNEGEYNL